MLLRVQQKIAFRPSLVCDETPLMTSLIGHACLVTADGRRRDGPVASATERDGDTVAQRSGRRRLTAIVAATGRTAAASVTC